MQIKTVAVISSVFATAISFAGPLQMTNVVYLDKGIVKAGSLSPSYSNYSTGNFHDSVGGSQGAEQSYVTSLGEVTGSDNSISGFNSANAWASVVGAGTANGTAVSYTRVYFNVLEDTTFDYMISAVATAEGGQSNRARVRLFQNGNTGGPDFLSASEGQSFSGSIALATGSYSMEIYSKVGVSARSRSAETYAYGNALAQTNFTLSTQAVPEPSCLIVIAAGAALLRKRRKA